jgi:proteasome accessory factor B
MARKLGVTERTVARDIHFMKTKRKLPIAYDPRRYGFYYTQPVHAFPKQPLTEADIFAMMVAHKAVAQYTGTTFEKPLQAAFQKLTGQLDNRERHTIANLGDALSFRPFAPEDSDMRAFKTVSKAVANRCELRFRYRNFGDNRVIPRRLQPYHLLCFESRWYMLGYDVRRRKVQTYQLARLCEPRVLRRRFVKPRNFHPDDHFKHSLGIMKGDGDKTHEVIIELDRRGTDLVRGRRWHPSQQLKQLENGHSRLTLRLSTLEEIERQILSWGTHATVVGPECLRRRLAAVGSELCAKYSSGKDAFHSVPNSNPDMRVSR